MFSKLKKFIGRYETKFCFGATCAIITNLGLVAGLRTGEHAKVGILGGMLVIAVADNISDSVGIHIYQESVHLNKKEVWVSTLSNFLTRLIVSLTFILLVFFLPIQIAAAAVLIWGLFLLAVISYAIAREQGINPYLAIAEHLGIAIAVIIASNYLGHSLIHKFNL